MKKKSLVLFLALLATASNWAFAQLPSADSIDVLHYNLTIDLGATVQKQMRGVADIQFVLTKPCNAVSFDLICDSVRPVSLDGTVTRGFSYDPDERLLRVYVSGGQPGDTHTLSVPYVSNGYVEHYGWGGLHMDNNIYYNLGVAFREYPHAFGRAWFPCRDNMYDKASYIITVTSQPGWRAICSGIRQSETTAPNGTNSSTWTINQPTPTYLVSISSAPWQVIEREYQGEYGTYPAIIGSIVVHDSATVRHAFDILDDVVPAYERAFGPYRWERIGYITTPMGSMEHVSNIGLVAECAASTDSPCQMTMCHELGHAWFGNLVTCTTVGDMWINEGGASFCEEVAAAAAYGNAWADDYYQKNLVNVLLNAHLSDDGYRALSGMPERITYGTTTYKKGALVWHSLRGLMGDSLFTASMHRLFSSCAFGNIDAAGLRDSLSLYSGLDLTDFFDFHVFTPGFVDFSLDLGINGNDHHVTLRQHLKGTDSYPRTSRVPVTFFSADRSMRHKEWLTVAGPLSELTLSLPFQASFAIVDFDHDLSDACSDDTALLVRKGVVDMPHAFCKVNVPEAPSTPSWIHVGLHFAHPDGDTVSGIVRMADRYWQVTGSVHCSATGRFLYNMGSNGSSGASNIDMGFFDRPYTLDSIWLLYRPDSHSPWQRASNSRTSSSSITTGYFTYRLLPGQYTLAVCDTNIIPLMRIDTPSDAPSFRIYPNPSAASFRIDMGGYDKKIDVQIYDTMGRKVLEMCDLNDGDTIRHNLSAGTYIVLIKNNFLSLQSQIIVQ